MSKEGLIDVISKLTKFKSKGVLNYGNTDKE